MRRRREILRDHYAVQYFTMSIDVQIQRSVSQGSLHSSMQYLIFFKKANVVILI